MRLFVSLHRLMMLAGSSLGRIRREGSSKEIFDGSCEKELLDTWWWLTQLGGKVKQVWPRMASSVMNTWVIVGTHTGGPCPTEDVLDGGRLEESFQHTTGAPVLQALVRRQWVFGPVAAVTKFAHVQSVTLLVFVLEVSFEWVVAGKRSSTVRTFLRLVDPATCRRWHTQGCSGTCSRHVALLSCCVSQHVVEKIEREEEQTESLRSDLTG